MFTRVVEIHTKPGKARELSNVLNEKVLPILQNQQGFVDEIVLVSAKEPDLILGLSFWQAEADAERYNKEQFKKVSDILGPLVQTTPKVQTFNVDTALAQGISQGKAA